MYYFLYIGYVLLKKKKKHLIAIRAIRAIKIIMQLISPSLVEHALIFKFFYINQSRATITLCAFRAHKKLL